MSHPKVRQLQKERHAEESSDAQLIVALLGLFVVMAALVYALLAR